MQMFTKETLEFVAIPVEEYARLLEDSHVLTCLREAGVDNWEGYHAAFDGEEE